MTAIDDSVPALKAITRRFIQDFCICGRRVGDSPGLSINVEWRRDQPLYDLNDFDEHDYDHPLSLQGQPGALRVKCTEGQNLRQFIDSLTLAVGVEFLEQHSGAPADELGTKEMLRGMREGSNLSLTNVAEDIGVAEATLASWEHGEKQPTDHEVYSWYHAFGLVVPRQKALVRVSDFTQPFVRWLQDDPIRLRQLSPAQFEQFIAERLERMGYNVTLNGKTTEPDGGIDLIAVPKDAGLGSFVLAAQVKHHQNGRKVGSPDVNGFLAHSHRFHLGLLVTNTFFTRNAVWAAKEAANPAFLKLRDFNDLKRWLQGQFGSPEEWREIPDEIAVARGLTVPIPKPTLDDRGLGVPRGSKSKL